MSETSKILLNELFEFIYLLSKRSKMVFVAFTQMHTDIECTVYMPLAPPRGKAPCFQRAPRPVGLAVHHQAVQSFVNVLGLVKTTRVIAGKTHSQFPILKCYDGCSATR